MKNIVLIGNGFDLAHGLKTSYEDFLSDYMDPIVETVNHSGIYDDENWGIDTNAGEGSFSRVDVNFLFNDKKIGRVNRKNLFFGLLSSLKNPLWADLEGLYYITLRNLAHRQSRKEGISPKEDISALNRGFKAIQQELIKYLDKIDIENTGLQPYMWTKFEPLIDDSLLIINFNYTSTLNRYDLVNQKNVEILNFHGSLSNISNNPIIFGYGDTKDDHYSTIENLNDNRYLEHSKPTLYPLSNNSLHMNNWLNTKGSEGYNIHIIGLSCGITDRVLLNTLLEYHPCRNIYLHYYDNSDNFKSTVNNISRAFFDKRKFNERMIPFHKRYKYA